MFSFLFRIYIDHSIRLIEIILLYEQLHCLTCIYINLYIIFIGRKRKFAFAFILIFARFFFFYFLFDLQYIFLFLYFTFFFFYIFFIPDDGMQNLSLLLHCKSPRPLSTVRQSICISFTLRIQKVSFI